MQLHELKPTAPRKVAKRIGRGGKRGKTSGRGGKGQTARAGTSGRPEMRDFIKKLPKLRGHGVNRARTVNNERVRPTVINLSKIDAVFAAGDTVSPKTLVAAQLVNTIAKRAPKVKILATGDLTKKLNFEGCELSEAAQKKIESAGGTVAK